MTWHDVDTSRWLSQPPGVRAVDIHEGFITEWHCPPPELGVKFRVTKDEWGEIAVDPGIATTIRTALGDQAPRMTMPVRRIYTWTPPVPKVPFLGPTWR
jgi:hypothetical protein